MSDNQVKTLDIKALRAKYDYERDKRIRPDGEAQYMAPVGSHERFITHDPFADGVKDRAPLTDEVEVLILGGGWTGLLASVRLAEQGVDDIRIIDDGADFGGTWYWNRYPGAQCDIESYVYIPLLEETGYIPKEKYSYAPEMHEHAQRIARKYGLYEKAVFQTRVERIDWDETSKRWIVSTNRGDTIKARFFICCIGPFSRLRLPDIPGFDEFEGHSFHTGRWDYAYTGGDHGGNLTKLSDKKVAVIGTGATAVQAIPHVGKWAEHLYVFQRTPSSIDVRGNKPTDPDWIKSLAPGWKQARSDNFDSVVRGEPFEVDLVSDGWTEIFRKVPIVHVIGAVDQADKDAVAERKARLEYADFEKMSEIRARVDQFVSDPDTAEALKPWYAQFCKRPCFNDDYLPTFARPNVTLVDVSGTRGVERITKKGIVANGQEYEVDCIIYATGYEVSGTFRRKYGFGVFGKDGLDLFDYWEQGMRTFHGHSVHNFPNFFIAGWTQVGASWNFCAVAAAITEHVAHIVAATRRIGDDAVIEATQEGEDAWVSTIRSFAGFNDAFLESCTPGYYNNEGKFKETVATFPYDQYAPGLKAFQVILGDWRASGAMDGMAITN
ncbi:monooxygenase [Sphingomonas sp. Root710]|uniref:flavin-containing monooxygenase n=1 Tax=Sphingomonas sp. Root710 TaxID=1736594 RepID=UPI0006F69699|nr:NAD(P)/FAD-dependent oxidoreductase [Sphingomonas sp. Root710]KRB80642.1 monooxygenase [Sphingomonas sp. Root710]